MLCYVGGKWSEANNVWHELDADDKVVFTLCV